jgi:hypothetical protein
MRSSLHEARRTGKPSRHVACQAKKELEIRLLGKMHDDGSIAYRKAPGGIRDSAIGPKCLHNGERDTDWSLEIAQK